MRLTTVPALLLTLSLGACAIIETRAAPPSQPQRLDIPRGHYPPAGSCRIWIPGVPPGQQSAPGQCAELQKRVPANGVLVHG